MKKLCLFLSVCLLFLFLTACKSEEKTVVSGDTSSGSKETVEAAYHEYMAQLDINREEAAYAFRDIDGNGCEELILKLAKRLTVYTYDGYVTALGEQQFLFDAVQLLYSGNPKAPGIFCVTKNGNIFEYGYITVKDRQLSYESLWQETYTEESKSSAASVQTYSQDEFMINESKSAYYNNREIAFIDFTE